MMKFYFLYSSHKARNDFIRTIHHTMHESVRRISVASLKTQASRMQQSVMRQHSHQNQHQHPHPCGGEMDNASTSALQDYHSFINNSYQRYAGGRFSSNWRCPYFLLWLWHVWKHLMLMWLYDFLFTVLDIFNVLHTFEFSWKAKKCLINWLLWLLCTSAKISFYLVTLLL